MKIKAENLLALLKEKAIGRTIITPPMGEWPGGEAVITAISPDPACPEIVFQVQSKDHGSIGVFCFEVVDALGLYSIEDLKLCRSVTELIGALLLIERAAYQMDRQQLVEDLSDLSKRMILLLRNHWPQIAEPSMEEVDLNPEEIARELLGKEQSVN